MARAFLPVSGSTVSIDVAATSSAVKVAAGGYHTEVDVRIANSGTATVWIKRGDATAAATTSDMPVLAGVTEVLRFRIQADGTLYLAAIAASGTGKIYFTLGEGI